MRIESAGRCGWNAARGKGAEQIAGVGGVAGTTSVNLAALSGAALIPHGSPLLLHFEVQLISAALKASHGLAWVLGGKRNPLMWKAVLRR